MITLGLLFVIFSLVLFILAALNVPGGRFNLVAAGLACYVAAQLVGRIA